MKMLILLFSFFVSSFAFAQTGAFFTYEGILTDTSGTPITTSQSVKFQVIYNGSCVAFEESQTVSPGTNGEFSVIVGTGSRTDTTGNTVAQIFGASGTLNCQSSSAQTITGFTTRQLHIRVGSTDLSPDVTLTNVPFAYNAQRLADKTPTDFVQIKAASNVTQTNVESIFGRFSVLDNMLNGNFSGVPVTGLTGLTNSSIDPAAAIARTKLASGTANHVLINDATGVMSSEAQLAVTRGGTGISTAPTNGQLLIGNGTGYSLGNIVAGSGITVTPAAGSITIASSGSGPTGAAGGDLSGTYPNPNVNKVNGLPFLLSAPISGQYVRFDGSNFVNSAIVASDLPFSGATAGTYTSVTVDTRGRVTAGTNPTTVAGYGITDAFVNGGNSFGAAPTIGTNNAQGFAIKTNNIARMVFDTAGNIGIGTSSPAQMLDVAGNIKGTQLCIGSDCRAAWPSGAGSGTVTSINLGPGLNGGPITTSGTINLDPELVALNGLSSAGFVIRNGAANYAALSGSFLSVPNSVVLRDSSGFSAVNGLTLNNGSSNVTMHAQIGSSYDLYWPMTQPTAGSYLTSDAGGNMQWINPNFGSSNIAAGAILDNHINASAAIARSKLASGTANRIVVNNSSGVMSDAAAIAAGKALVSDANGIPSASSVTNTELSYLSGVTSPIQTQITNLNSTMGTHVSKAGDTMTGMLTMANGTEIRFLDGSGNYVGFKSPTTAGNVSWRLPAFDGSNGMVLQTNGAGTLSWATPTSTAGTPNYAAYYNAGGGLSSEQYLAVSRGGTGAGSFTPGGLVMAGGSTVSPLTSMTCTLFGGTLEWTGTTWGCSADIVTSGSPGSKVNYVLINGGVTGSPATIQAAGSDINIELKLAGKGAAPVRVMNDFNVQNETVSKTYRTLASIGNSGSTIDFSQGNLQFTTLSCAPFTLANMKDGATYTFVVKGATASTCAFTTNNGLTLHLPPDHGPTEAGKHTVYTIMVLGGDAYISWVTGY